MVKGRGHMKAPFVALQNKNIDNNFQLKNWEMINVFIFII